MALLILLALPLVFAVAPTITSPDDQNIARGDSVTVRWTVTDADNTSGNYTVYWNGNAVTVGDWDNATAFAFDAGSSWAYNANHNLTVDAGDWISNITDTVFIKVGGQAFASVRIFAELLPLVILGSVLVLAIMQLRKVTP